ncbi:hypothetical protein Bbelb_299700 [Branchiostoma belcheri]|nr:hypothetical protein Bbelb_299700 [Branchiostoma belcheri]
MYRRLKEVVASHPAYRVPAPPPKLTSINQASLGLQTRKTQRSRHEASHVSVNKQPSVLSAEAYHVPAPPPKRTPKNQVSLDLQRQTSKSRRSRQEAPKVCMNNQALALSAEGYHVPAPPPKPTPVDQASQDLQQQTGKARRSRREVPRVNENKQALALSAEGLHIPAPPPKPTPVDQASLDLQRQTSKARRSRREAPKVSMNNQTSALSAEGYHVPAPPPKPTPEDPASLDPQRQTSKARRSRREAPKVSMNNQTSALSAEGYHVPAPPPKPTPVDQASLGLKRQTGKASRSHRKAPHVHVSGNNNASTLCAEADLELSLGYKPLYVPPGGLSQDQPNRYSRASPTFEELGRALEDHADRIFYQKYQTEMFGEDLSSSKLPAKKRGTKVTAMEKVYQLEQERHNAVPFNDEEQLLRAAYTTAMFGDDLSDPSAVRRVPVQPSLVGARNHYARHEQEVTRVEKPRPQRYPEPDVYITVEDADYRAAQRLKREAAKNRSSERTASKLSSQAPQRHSLTGRRTAAGDNTSEQQLESLLMEPRPPMAAKPDSDQSARARAWHQKRAQHRTRDSRLLKRRCESPSGPALLALLLDRKPAMEKKAQGNTTPVNRTRQYSTLQLGGEGAGGVNPTDGRRSALLTTSTSSTAPSGGHDSVVWGVDVGNRVPSSPDPTVMSACQQWGSQDEIQTTIPSKHNPVLNDRPTRLVSLSLNNTPTRLVSLSLVLNDTPTRLVSLSLVLNNTPTRLVSLNNTPTRLVSLSLVLNDTPTRLVSLSLVLNDTPTRLVSLSLVLNDTPTRLVSLSLVLNNTNKTGAQVLKKKHKNLQKTTLQDKTHP